MERDLSLDRFRGIAVMLMALGDNIADAAGFPVFLKHAPDVGFTVADIVAPLFIFAIAVTYQPSFTRRLAKSKSGAYIHNVYKYLALIGIGTIFSAGGVVVSRATNWGVLQAIGMAGLIALIFVRLPWWVRALSALGVLIVYQLLLDNFMLSSVLHSGHGGFFGSVSWSAMLILATAMAELFAKGKKWFLPATGLLALLAAGSLFAVPISKNRVSLSYVLASLAICCAFYFMVDLLSRHIRLKGGIVSWWGENPLLLYALHLICMGILQLPLALLGMGMPLWYGIASDAALFAGLSLIAWTIHRKHILIKL